MQNQLAPAVIPQQSTIIIGNITIRQDAEGRYCINDLHKASGGAPKHKPSEWLRNKQTSKLIAELSKAGIPAIQSKQQLGTFVCKDLAYDYAMWIAPSFKVKVIRTFDNVVTGQIQATPVIHDPQTRALIQLLTEQDFQKQELARQSAEQERQALQIEHVRQEVAALTPRLTASSLNKIQGAISHAAKWYRQSQAVKHIKLSVNESCIYFQMMLLDKFKVADIGYIDDVAKAYRLLQIEAKKYQDEYNSWIERNSLFARGASC